MLDEVTAWQRRVQRERRARLDAERLLEEKGQQLARAQAQLVESNRALEQRVQERTQQLVEAKVRAEAANAAKGRFLANMSHEIRTPLNGVVASVDLLLESAVDAEQRELAQTAVQCSDALLDLVTTLLDLVRLDEAALPLQGEPFDPAELLPAMTAVFGAEAARKGLLLLTTTANPIPAVIGDRARLQQVLMHLVGNALKFTACGGVTVRLGAAAAGIAGRTRLEYTVTDTGLGIAPIDQQRLFADFEQVDGSSTRRHGGLGLGLSISRRLVRLMGGDIGLSSTLGQGSTFTVLVELPLASGAPAVAPAAPVPLVDTRVLVVDDNPLNRDLAGRMLVQDGCVVTTAASGEEALEALARQDFDLVLLDGHMPGMSGPELAARVRSGHSSARDAAVPIVGMTADAVVDFVTACKAAGMQSVLTKPFRRLQLLDAVRRHARRPAARR